MKNRYLVTPSGSTVGTRFLPALISFGWFLGAWGLFVVAGIVSDTYVNSAHRGDVLAVAFLFALASTLVSVVLMWFWIFRSAKKLREAEPLALVGDDRAREAAHYTLVRVFRADARLRAFYTLGLLAERRGDFGEAQDLFVRARQSVPSMLSTRAGRRIPIMCLGHVAFCQAAAGMTRESGMALAEAHRRIPSLYVQGMFDGLLDDSAWGGAASMNRALDEIEARRDPRAMVALAGALLAFKNGHFRQCVDAASGEDAMLRQNLMAHEGELIESLKSEALAKLAGGEYRGSAAGAQTSEWVALARG